MKTSDFFIRHKNGFNKVTGYIDTITDEHDNKFKIGFHYEKSLNWWVATHIESGLLICHGKTRKECLQKVKSKQFLNLLNKTKDRKDVKQYIDDMTDYLKRAFKNEKSNHCK